jgi:hypothetical protein
VNAGSGALGSGFRWRGIGGKAGHIDLLEDVADLAQRFLVSDLLPDRAIVEQDHKTLVHILQDAGDAKVFWQARNVHREPIEPLAANVGWVYLLAIEALPIAQQSDQRSILAGDQRHDVHDLTPAIWTRRSDRCCCIANNTTAIKLIPPPLVERRLAT